VDGIFFTGKASKPVYLVVNGEKAELKDASAIWGKDCVETEDLIRKELGDEKEQYKIGCIGPGGEKLSLIAGICNDKGRYAARSGVGAVMGSKNLKALAVTGKAKVEVANSEEIKAKTKKFAKELDRMAFMKSVLSNRLFRLVGFIARVGSPSKNPGDLWKAVLKKYGTMGITAMSAENGDSPVKNWSGAGFKDFPLDRGSKISDDRLLKYEVKKYGCYSCPVRCGGIMKVDEGPYPLEHSHKPEYETLCQFGTLCLVDDTFVLLKINDMVNRGGLDTISTGATCAFAIECFENGILTKQDTGGLELKWGNSDALIKLVDMIIYRKGIGDVLADGVKVAAKKIGKGSEKFAVHAGGQEPAAHDPKFDPGNGCSYECEPTPGRHTISSYTWQDLMEVKRFSKEGSSIPLMTTKKRHLEPLHRMNNQIVNSKLKQVMDGTGTCLFGLCCGPKMPIYEWINAATGWNKSPEDYLLIGERIETLRQSFNVREGLKPDDFKMHGRMKGAPPLSYGPHKGVTLDIESMKKYFFDAYGWDLQSGKPAKARLEKLGLTEVVKDIYG
jgi:aldehyde:ferredoxin oxidoreductase